jgi:hypothetical protein
VVDPVTVGVAAAVLLASKFGEGFAKDAGGSAWNATKRLREVVVAKFKGDPEAETAVATLATAPTEEATATVARMIAAAMQADANFGSEVEQLVAHAGEVKGGESFVAQAFEHAKQVNIRGDNSGQINL